MIRRFRPAILVLAAFPLLKSSAAAAQTRVVYEGPTVTFGAPPRLEVVEPGLQVVPDQPEEVYFSDGFYWTRHGGRWFRSHDWHGGWDYVDERGVPGHLGRIPPGRYAHWHREEHERRELRRDERQDERRDDHHDDRRDHREEERH